MCVFGGKEAILEEKSKQAIAQATDVYEVLTKGGLGSTIV